jgi:hypothetical protein
MFAIGVIVLMFFSAGWVVSYYREERRTNKVAMTFLIVFAIGIVRFGLRQESLGIETSTLLMFSFASLVAGFLVGPKTRNWRIFGLIRPH